MIAVEFRRTIWSSESVRGRFDVGATLADIAAAFPDSPAEFIGYGVIMLCRPDGSDPHQVPRELWSKVRPKDGAGVLLTVKPGDFGDGGQILQIVGAIALVALVTWVSGGGLAFLAPSILGPLVGAGTIGASVAAAAVGVAGSFALGALTSPTAPQSGGTARAQLGQAGVSGNVLGAYQQVPGVLGRIRVSPPYLTRPYTTAQDNVLTVRGVLGVCGPCEITDLKINDTDAADIDGLTYETLEGWADDPELTIVTQQVFEEGSGIQMSSHIFDVVTANTLDQLLEPFADSYPKPHVFKTASGCEKFRMLFAVPQGMSYSALYRLRIRNRAGGGWVNLPELLLRYSTAPHFFEIVLEWQKGGGDPWDNSLTAGFQGAYYSNSEWEADSYFYDSGPTFPSLNAAPINSKFEQYRYRFFLDPDVFPISEYDVEITKSAYTEGASSHDINTYTAGFFTFTSTLAGEHFISDQENKLVPVYIHSTASFRAGYPIVERGLALIAFTAKNIEVRSVSAVMQSYVPVWDGVDWDTVEPSRNPGALLRWVLTGGLNARPVVTTLLDDTLADFFDYCEAEGLTCDVLTGDNTSVEAAASLAAQCGDAALRRAEKWGVVIDRDRSADAAVAMFGPHNMTEPLSITKSYGLVTEGLAPSYLDEDDDYAVKEIDGVIFDDDVQTSDESLVEQIAYEGLTTETLVRRRALIDLRRNRLRSKRYSWGCHLSHLNIKKGDLVAVAHDVLIDTYAQARVRGWTQDTSGNLLTVELNSEIEDAPVNDFEGIFAVDAFFSLAQVFSVGVLMGLQIQHVDGSITMIPISGVVGATLTVSGTVAAPAGLARADLAAVGPRDREVRRIIVADIRPRSRMRAMIEGVDEAPGIFEGL